MTTSPPSSGSSPLPAELRARILAAASASPVPSRAVGRRRQAVALAAGFAVPVALSLYLGGPTFRARPVPYVVALAVAWLGVALAATLGGVTRGRSMLGRPAFVHFLVAAVTPVALLATALLTSTAWPETQDDHPVAAAHAICVAVTLVCALGPLGAFAVLRRHSDPVAPRLTGAAIGAASGGWGAVVIELHCTHASTVHVLLGHVLPVVLLTLIGVLVGDRVVALRGAA